MKKIINLLAVLLAITAWAQLAPFTVTATKLSDETCPNNGAISWTTSGTAPGSVMTYSVVRTSDNTPVATTSADSFTGLPSGSYKIVATQTLGNNSNQATSSNIFLANQRVALVYNVTKDSDVICGNDGQFTVNVTSGRAPYRYQILDSANNVLLAQDSKTFTNLAAGDYRVRVVDQCGAGAVTNITIASKPSFISNFAIQGTLSADCSSVYISIYSTNWSVKYPLTMQVQYTDPATGTLKTYSATSVGQANPVVAIPKLDVPNINLTTTVTDACGTTKTITSNYKFTPLYSASTFSTSCGGSVLTFLPSTGPGQSGGVKFRVNFTSYPAGFDPAAFDSNHANDATQHYYGSNGNPVPPGTYQYQIVDVCGYTVNGSITVTNSAPAMFSEYTDECTSTTTRTYKGTVSSAFYLTSVTVTAAPAAFVSQFGPLPYQIPADKFLTFNGNRTAFILNGLPLGNYQFSYTTNCNGDVNTYSATVAGPAPYTVPTPQVSVNCIGQFKVNIPGYTDYYFVQKYNPATGKWGKTNAVYTDGTGQNPNASGYVFDWTNYNNFENAPEGPGRYRIVANGYHTFGTHALSYPVAKNGNQDYYFCDAVVMGEFTVGSALVFSNAYAWQCSAGVYDVAVSATTDMGPLTYSLVSDATNNATLVSDNGTNPIFRGLNGGTYYVRVTNACGNFITKKLEIAQLGKPGIRPVADCTTGTLRLQVDGLDYLNFEWYKATDPGTILSTSSTLNLGVYDASKAGVYKVRIYSTNALYCINSTQEIQVTMPSLTEANPGTGRTATVQFTGTPTINLYNYLNGPYDSYGSWSQISGPTTSLLLGSDWNIAASAPGTYVFRYTVNPLCGGSAKFTEVTLKLEKICYKLPAMASAGNPALPTTTGITLLNRNNTGTNNWPVVRNGGWLAVEANSAGIVLNRVAFDAGGNPVGIPAANFVTGMAVYDTTNKCLKIYDGTRWSCYTTQTCPE